jgi:hypothetical protein
MIFNDVLQSSKLPDPVPGNTGRYWNKPATS